MKINLLFVCFVFFSFRLRSNSMTKDSMPTDGFRMKKKDLKKIDFENMAVGLRVEVDQNHLTTGKFSNEFHSDLET